MEQAVEALVKASKEIFVELESIHGMEKHNKMKIEVGKFYRTENGDKARIYATDGEHNRQIHGAVLQSDGRWVIMWWSKDGKCFHNPFLDLIAEWTEPLDFDPSCLPAWAGWIAMRSDGVWVWSVNEMEVVGLNGSWHCYTNKDTHDLSYIPKEYAPKNYTGDWRDSLRKVSDL